MKYEQKIENLLREKIKDEVVLIPALKIKSVLCSNYKMENATPHNNKKFASAIAYLAFIKTNQVKSLDEISDMFEVTRVDVGRSYIKLKRILGIKYCKKEKMSMMGTSCVRQRMPKDFLGKIKISEKSKKYTIQILKKIEKNLNFQGMNPQIICAAAVYLSLLWGREHKTQREVAYLFRGTEVSLRQRYKQIVEELGLEEQLKLKQRKWCGRKIILK